MPYAVEKASANSVPHHGWVTQITTLKVRRPCSYTPIHSLTGPVGQPFAPHPGGSSSHPGN